MDGARARLRRKPSSPQDKSQATTNLLATVSGRAGNSSKSKLKTSSTIVVRPSHPPMQRSLRDRKPVSYAVRVVESPESSPASSPEKPTNLGLKVLFGDDDNDMEDEIVVGGAVQTPTRGRSLRPRPSQTKLNTVTYTPKQDSRSRSRRKSRAKSQLRSNSSSAKPLLKKAAIESSRNKIRTEIAAVTKVKQDNFLLAHKEHFLPLLPESNYIRRLGEVNGSKDVPSIIPYRLLKEQPKGVTATLKPYQLSGLSFLVHLYENGMSGMLGDEMGLGKTLQTLSLFQYLEENIKNADSDGEVRPYLVVCPLSVLSSWISEARKWCPGLNVLRFHGPVSERQRLKKIASGYEDRYGNELTRPSKRKRASTTNHDEVPGKSAEPYNMVVTTYETYQAEQSWFKHAFVWRYVVLDEGHKIKNNVTQVASALQSLRAEYRLILTGTPLQNNLHEMWALLHWLYPDVFHQGTSDLFKESFDLTRGKVSTSVMDSARKLLELIMLRRMKDSPGVNLGLPPKTEILLYVPLTPMQRFWYTRLLTKAGDGLLDELFKDIRVKEKDTLGQEAEDDSEELTKLEKLDKVISEKPDQWSDTKEIMRQSIAQEGKDVTTKGAWQKLNNLVMQLRKCCSHPYQLPNAAPDPYHIGPHVIHASGKFIVLEKLLQELVIKQNSKVLIFSEFTKVLNCCEDLLQLMGGDGTAFKFMRLDGSTGRARRNLNMRLFNDKDPSSPYKIMLIGTKAGGLGINLTSANNVIFLDETWNPQLTLQAEARAHRIGQTKPVTIYKLCTQGTVEEQMLGRIRKKLYLSAKITESMQSLHDSPEKASKKKRGPIKDDVPNLSTTQLKSLIRRGAQTLSHPEIDATEMLSWDLDTILEKCKDRPSDAFATESNAVDEEKWLSAMEKVETAVFDGKKYQKALDKKDKVHILPDDITREDRRKGKNTTIMVDGFAINKESMNCGEWEAVPTLAGKDPRLADVKREKRPEVINQEHCQICYEGGEIVCCHGCPRAYHRGCLSKEFQLKSKGWQHFFCPQHECVDCSKKTNDAGGLIYRCRWCEHGYCEDCLDWDKSVLISETLPEYEMLDHTANDQAYYIVCHDCKNLHESDKVTKEWIETYQEEIEADFATFLSNEANNAVIETAAGSTTGSLTTAPTLATNSGISTPVTEGTPFETAEKEVTSTPKLRKRKSMVDPVVETRLGRKVARRI